jgi:hypothetical protein
MYRGESFVRIRSTAVAVFLLFVLIPGLAAGQTPSSPSDQARAGRDRLSLQAAGGPTLVEGNVVSAAFGYSPTSRLELVLNVERFHLPFERTTFTDGYSLRRGGTMTYVSGEVRYSLLSPERVSPFLLGGAGGGVSRLTVNAEFPDPVKNEMRVLYFGGGVRVPLRGGFSLVGDMRAMLALEGNDTALGILPVRAGVTWRF